MNLGFEEGTIDEQDNAGDYDWYITANDGPNSAKCAKTPQIFSTRESAALVFGRIDLDRLNWFLSNFE